MANRLKAMGMRRYRNGFDVTLHEDVLEQPLHWRCPRLVFVNSMGDLFHEAVPEQFIQRAFDVMRQCSQHTFQILTKRSGRMAEMAGHLPWPANIWMGVTVEDRAAVSRIWHLQMVPAAVRFLSIEPLLGPLGVLPLEGVHWVIVGGESGPGARPMQTSWVDEVLVQCRAANVPFFFKQWGGVRKDLTGRLLRGKQYNEMPAYRRDAAG